MGGNLVIEIYREWSNVNCIRVIFFSSFRNGDDNDYILDNNNSSNDKTLRIFSVTSVGLQCLSLFCHIRIWLVCIMNNLEKLVLLFLQRKCTSLSQNIV